MRERLALVKRPAKKTAAVLRGFLKCADLKNCRHHGKFLKQLPPKKSTRPEFAACKSCEQRSCAGCIGKPAIQTEEMVKIQE